MDRGEGEGVTNSAKQTGLTMRDARWAYVERLRQTGLYGDNQSTVLRALICDAIKDAIAKGIIKP